MQELQAILATLENFVCDDPSRAALELRWRAACAAWAPLPLSLADTMHGWDRLVAPGTALATALETVHFDDLVLALACRAGNAVAIAMFDERFLAQIPTYLGRNGVSPAFAEEVRQAVRLRLFVGTQAGGAAKLAGYTGGGPLGAWLRVVTIRCARDLQRQQKPDAPLEEAIGSHARDPDPELDYMKARYSQDFQSAFADVMANLQPKERNLLKLYFLDGLTVDEIGGLYSVHKSTVSRRLAECREQILSETRRLLGERLGASDTELESLWRLIESRVDISLRTLLATKR